MTPVCRTAAARPNAPAAATHDTLLSRCRSLRVHHGVRWVLAVPILAPLVKVAVHVIQAKRIGREATDRSGLPPLEVGLTGGKPNAKMERRPRSCTAGVFPLRF